MVSEAAGRSLAIDPRLLQRLNGIKLRSRFLVRGLYDNRHRTADLGSSPEFVDHRDYRPGDDLRSIDWRVYGRTDRFYVKRFEMESNMRVHCLLDTSDSMRVAPPAGLPGKLDLAAVIAGAISTMAVHQQDSAGLFCLGGAIEEVLPARQGRSHLETIYRHLAAPPGKKGGSFGELVRETTGRLGSRGVVFVITDALDELEPLFKALSGLRVRQQDVALIQVLDRDELEFPYDRMNEFLHPETGERIAGDGGRLRGRYLERLNAYLESIAGFCRKNQVDYLRLGNGDDLTRLLASYFLRRLMLRGGQRC